MISLNSKHGSKEYSKMSVFWWSTENVKVRASNIQTGLWNLSGEEPSELLENLSLEVPTGTRRN